MVTTLVAMCIGALMVQAGIAKRQLRLAAAVPESREKAAAVIVPPVTV